MPLVPVTTRQTCPDVPREGMPHSGITVMHGVFAWTDGPGIGGTDGLGSIHYQPGAKKSMVSFTVLARPDASCSPKTPDHRQISPGLHTETR